MDEEHSQKMPAPAYLADSLSITGGMHMSTRRIRPILSAAGSIALFRHAGRTDGKIIPDLFRKMQQRMCRLRALCITLLLIGLCSPKTVCAGTADHVSVQTGGTAPTAAPPASASDTGSSDRKGSLTLEFRDSLSGKPLQGEFTLYRIGEITEDSAGMSADSEEPAWPGRITPFIPGLPFTEQLMQGSGAHLLPAVEQWYRKLDLQDLPADQASAGERYRQKTGPDGFLIISDIRPGIYLAAQTGQLQESTADPFFLCIPCPEELTLPDGRTEIRWRYDICAAPKMLLPQIPSPSPSPVPDKPGRPAIPPLYKVQTGDESPLPAALLMLTGMLILVNHCKGQRGGLRRRT